MEVRYVEGDDTGWLRVTKNAGSEIALPEYLKVDFTESKKALGSNIMRDYFKVLEGREKGTLASVKQKPNGQS